MPCRLRLRARGSTRPARLAAQGRPAGAARARATPADAEPSTSGRPVQRRHAAVLLAAAAASLQWGAAPALAAAVAAPALAPFEDEKDAFTMQVPEGWTFAMPQASTDRFRAGTSSVRTLVWYPESGTDVNVTAVINTPGADYTTLASFGSAADFGQNVVNSMDRSFSLPKGGGPPKAPTMVSRLLSTANRDNSYFTEYTIQKLLPGGGAEPKKMLYSRVAIGTNGHSRRFYTVTATFPESKSDDFKDAMHAAVESFRLTKGATKVV